MKNEIANIRSQASAIRQAALELVSELAALPALNAPLSIEEQMRAIAEEFGALSGGCVHVECGVWRMFYDHSKEFATTPFEYRIYFSKYNDHASGTTLESARAAAEAVIRAKKSAAQAAAVE
jgi:hypothetical protein